MDRTEETDEEVDLRPRRPAEDLLTVDRGVIGDGERDCRLYDEPVRLRRGIGGPPGVPNPGVVGLFKELLAVFVPGTPFLVIPFATRFEGRVDTAAI